MSIEQIIEVLQAAKAGKTLQSRDNSIRDSAWRDEIPYTYPLVHRDWRVKPEPREDLVDEIKASIAAHASEAGADKLQRLKTIVARMDEKGRVSNEVAHELLDAIGAAMSHASEQGAKWVDVETRNRGFSNIVTESGVMVLDDVPVAVAVKIVAAHNAT